MSKYDLLYMVSPKYKDLKKEVASDKELIHKVSNIIHMFEKAYEKDLQKREFYFIMACRYGCEEGHIYPLGLHLTLEKALVEAEEHRDYRGGKYECKIYKCTMGCDGNMELVYDQGWHSAERVNRNKELRERAKES